MALCTTAGPFDLLSGAFANRTSGSGVVANPTFNRNVLRQYLKPVQPNNAFQINARSRFTTVSQGYSQLTQTQVAEWAAAAANIERTGRLHLPYRLNSATLYGAVNNLRLLNAQSLSSTAPDPTVLGAPLAIETVGMTATNVQIEWTPPAGAPVGTLYLVRFSRPLLTPARNARPNELVLPFVVRASNIGTVTTLDVARTTLRALGWTIGSFIGVAVQTVSPDYVPGQTLFQPRREITNET